jgi:hypothetical protein
LQRAGRLAVAKDKKDAITLFRIEAEIESLES